MSFDLQEFQTGSFVVHCPVQEEAIEFLSFLHQNDFRWRTGVSLLSTTHWDNYGCDTYYECDPGTKRIGYQMLNGDDQKGRPAILFSTLGFKEKHYEIASESELLALLGGRL